MMHSVDPMEIMLSDVFDKVFYKMNPNVKECPECVGEGVIQRDEGDIDLTIVPCEDCDGWGTIEVDAPRPHGFDRDVGYMDVDKIECPECEGTGEKEPEDVS